MLIVIQPTVDRSIYNKIVFAKILHKLTNLKQMKTSSTTNRINLWLGFCLLLGLTLAGIQPASSQQKTGRLVINADLGEHTISRHIYGHFSEHLGRCIYDGYQVGDNYDIPTTNGIRNDIVEALRETNIPNLRWPGGCFADEYHWMDGIGSLEQRPSMINTHWGGLTEDNSFGTHEFFDLCEQLGAEPVICGNVGSGTVKEMSQWVEYINLDGISPMADLRKVNGREEPWNIKYWGVGNENWGCGGRMTAQFYADQYKRYATYCRNYGENRLMKIAGGANRADYEWTETLMREIPSRYMWGLSLHHYTNSRGSATQFGEQEYFTLLRTCLNIAGVIDNHMTIMDKYDPQKRVALVVDEWGTWHDTEPGTNRRFLYQQNTLRDAMVAGLSLNYFNERCERVKMANIAQTVNVLQALVLTNEAKMLLTPTYHIFEMYKVHHDATLLPAALETPDYEFDVQTDASTQRSSSQSGDLEFTGNKLPMISASASRSGDGTINVSIVNIDPHNGNNFTIEVRGADVSKVSGRVLTANEINSMNTFEDPTHVKPVEFKDVSLKKGVIQANIPAKSIVVLEIK
jgi:alpha-L-arabinofuranosidase